MTNKEAIEILDTIPTISEQVDALEMAIEALELKDEIAKLEREWGAEEIEPCEDVISRQALRQKLREHYDFFVNAYGGFNNLSLNDKFRVDEITNCIAMVVNAPSVTPQPRWIPVSERLPESDDDVLVVDDAGGLTSVGIDWFDIYNGRWVNSQNVTAWMPLPKPYERGESDAK